MSNRNMAMGVFFWYDKPLFRHQPNTMNEQENLQEALIQLKSEHRDLDDAIHALSQRSVPDMIQIQRLKKRKLQLRDEIMKIESKLLPDIIA